MKLPFGFSLATDFNGDGILFFVLLILGIGFAFLMNKPRRNTQSSSIQWFPWLIPTARSFVLLLLLLLLFSPEISLHRHFSTPKHLAVIVDQSRSMGQAWEGDVEELQVSIFETIQKLEANHQVDVWSMDGGKISAKGLNFNGDLSVFDWSPSSGDIQNEGDLISQVFLFSDGHLNGGRSPLDLDWTRSKAVNIVLPLKPEPNAFFKLIDVNYAEAGDNSEMVIIGGTIHQEGLLGRRATVQVHTENDHLLGEVNIPIRQGFQDMNVPIRVGDIGLDRVRVSLSVEDGEFFTERMVEIEQSRELPVVLIVSERINTLHKFLVQSFSDSSYQVHVVSGTRGPGQGNIEIEIPDRIDLMLLNQPGDFALSIIEKMLSRLESPVAKPVILFYAGNDKLASAWNEILGVSNAQTNVGDVAQTSFWSETAGDHAFYLGLMGQGYAPGELMEYAPIKPVGHLINTPGVDLMVSGFGDSRQSALKISDNPPRATFSGSGYWKWFFHPQSKSSFEKLWDYLLVYLDEIASFQPVQLAISTSQAQTGAYVTGDVEIKDFDNRTIKAVELRVWQEDENGEKTVLTPGKSPSGEYQIQLDTKHPGEKVVIVEAYRFGELWGRDTSRIQLTGFNSEDQSRGVDEVFLFRLASRSGGQVIQLDENDLPNIPSETLAKASLYSFKGVHSSLVFAVLLLLLVLEWIWRRRSGLL